MTSWIVLPPAHAGGARDPRPSPLPRIRARRDRRGARHAGRARSDLDSITHTAPCAPPSTRTHAPPPSEGPRHEPIPRRRPRARDYLARRRPDRSPTASSTSSAAGSAVSRSGARGASFGGSTMNPRIKLRGRGRRGPRRRRRRLQPAPDRRPGTGRPRPPRRSPRPPLLATATARSPSAIPNRRGPLAGRGYLRWPPMASGPESSPRSRPEGWVSDDDSARHLDARDTRPGRNCHPPSSTARWSLQRPVPLGPQRHRGPDVRRRRRGRSDRADLVDALGRTVDLVGDTGRSPSRSDG